MRKEQADMRKTVSQLQRSRSPCGRKQVHQGSPVPARKLALSLPPSAHCEGTRIESGGQEGQRQGQGSADGPKRLPYTCCVPGDALQIPKTLRDVKSIYLHDTRRDLPDQVMETKDGSCKGTFSCLISSSTTQR